VSFRQRPKSLRPASESRPSARARNERSCRARSGGGRDQLLVVVGGSTRARRDSRQREAPQAPTACRRRLPARRTSRDISHPGEATSGRQNSPNRTSFPTPNQRCRAVRPGGVDRVSRASRGSRTSARPRVTPANNSPRDPPCGGRRRRARDRLRRGIAPLIRVRQACADSLLGGITQFEFSLPRSHAQIASWPRNAAAASAASRLCAPITAASVHQLRRPPGGRCCLSRFSSSINTRRRGTAVSGTAAGTPGSGRDRCQGRSPLSGRR
jgi:hypothetical protein